MARLTVRYLVERPRKSGAAYYWQPTQGLIKAGFLPRRLSDDRLEAIAQAEQFNTEIDRWRDHGTAPSGIIPNSLAAYDLEFQRDEDFTNGMAERTQADYLRNIKPALAWAGRHHPADLNRKAIKEWYRVQRDARGKAQSRHWFAALSRLLTFCVTEGHLTENPCHGLTVELPPSRTRVWTDAERLAFITAAEAEGHPSMGVAVMLGWCLGQRPTDLRKLAWSSYDGRTIGLRQRKTDQQVRIPVLPELRQLLDQLPRTSTQIVVSETTNRPYQESAFQHTFADIRDKAGLPADLQFRDLRRTLATALGAAGATEDQIMSITGHRSRSVLSVYVRPDDTTAKNAMRKLGKRP